MCKKIHGISCKGKLGCLGGIWVLLKAVLEDTRRKREQRSCLPLAQNFQQSSKGFHVIQTEILPLVAVRT